MQTLLNPNQEKINELRERIRRIYKPKKGERLYGTNQADSIPRMEKQIRFFQGNHEAKFLHAKEQHEVHQKESLEYEIGLIATGKKNLKFEIQNEQGQWIEVFEDYFKTVSANL